MSFQAQSMRQKCTNPEGYQLFVGMTHDLDFGLFVRNHWFLRNGVSKFNTIRSSEVYENLERFDFLLFCFFTAEDIMCTMYIQKKGTIRIFWPGFLWVTLGFHELALWKKEQQKIELKFIYYTHRLIWTIYELKTIAWTSLIL